MTTRPFIMIDPADQETLVRELGTDKARTAFMLWFRLNREAFRKGAETFEVSKPALSHDSGISTRHLKEVTAKLEALGFVQVRRRTRTTPDGHQENEENIYTLMRGAYRGGEDTSPPGETSSRGREDVSGHVPGNQFPLLQEVTRGINAPAVPKGTGRLSAIEKKRKRCSENTPVMIRIGKWFKRQDKTLWTVYEAEALAQLGNLPEDELTVVEDFYRASLPPKEDYRRQDVATLLNHWTGEVDKARKFQAAHSTSNRPTKVAL